MDRRNFFKTITGLVAGVAAAFAPKAKADDSIKANPNILVMNSDETLNWINIGAYRKLHYITQIDCCYTHKNGKKMRCAVLFDNNYIVEDFKCHEANIRRRAIEGGAWYPTKDTEYFVN